MRVNFQLLISTVVATLIGFLVAQIQNIQGHWVYILALLFCVGILSYFVSDMLGSWLTKVLSLHLASGEFGYRINGCWWQWIDNDDYVLVSWTEIRYISDQKSVRLLGIAFDKVGNVASRWNSTTSCLNDEDLQLCYYWSGERINKSEETVAGLGIYKFFDTKFGYFKTGSGHFSELFLGDSKQGKKTVELVRATEEEQEEFQKNYNALVRRKIQEKRGDVSAPSRK